MIIEHDGLSNLSARPEVKEAKAEVRLTAEIIDALHNWLEDDYEESEVWDQPSLQDQLFGNGVRIGRMDVQTDLGIARIFTSDGRKFSIHVIESEAK